MPYRIREITIAIISGLLAALTLTFVLQYANAVVDHKTFEKCVKKWAPSYVFNALDPVSKKYIEDGILSGNMTIVNVSNDFVNVYDCVWNLPNQYPPFVDLNK